MQNTAINQTVFHTLRTKLDRYTGCYEFCEENLRADSTFKNIKKSLCKHGAKNASFS